MESRTLQLVIQYDGSQFLGWQRQPNARTVQGVLEDAMERLYFLAKVQRGLMEAEAGQFVPHDEVRTRFGLR